MRPILIHLQMQNLTAADNIVGNIVRIRARSQLEELQRFIGTHALNGGMRLISCLSKRHTWCFPCMHRSRNLTALFWMQSKFAKHTHQKICRAVACCPTCLGLLSKQCQKRIPKPVLASVASLRPVKIG